MARLRRGETICQVANPDTPDVLRPPLSGTHTIRRTGLAAQMRMVPFVAPLVG